MGTALSETGKLNTLFQKEVYGLLMACYCFFGFRVDYKGELYLKSYLLGVFSSKVQCGSFFVPILILQFFLQLIFQNRLLPKAKVSTIRCVCG